MLVICHQQIFVSANFIKTTLWTRLSGYFNQLLIHMLHLFFESLTDVWFLWGLLGNINNLTAFFLVSKILNLNTMFPHRLPVKTCNTEWNKEYILRYNAVSCCEHPLVTDEGASTDVRWSIVYAHLPGPWPSWGILTTHYSCIERCHPTIWQSIDSWVSVNMQ